MTKEFFINFRGMLNNLTFLLFVFIFNLFCKNYIISEAKYYFEQTLAFRIKDIGFTIFILLIILVDTAGFFLKYPHVKHLFYKNVYRKEKGFLDMLLVPFFTLSGFIHFTSAILLGMLLTRSTDNELLKIVGVLIIIAREIIIFVQLAGVIYSGDGDGTEGEIIPVPSDISVAKNMISDLLLGLCSALIFTITWEASFGGMSHHMDFHFPKLFIGMCALSFMFYMPTRILFIMQDYYSAIDVKYKWLAFLSSILVPLAASVFVL